MGVIKLKGRKGKLHYILYGNEGIKTYNFVRDLVPSRDLPIWMHTHIESSFQSFLLFESLRSTIQL